MRLAVAAFAIAVCAFAGSVTASGKTIMQMPGPDVRLFLQVPPKKFGDLRRALLDFAAQEHLAESEFKNSPRGQGKQFFLLLHSDKYSFVFEKAADTRSLLVECYDLESDYARTQAKILQVPYETQSPFAHIMTRLKQRLRAFSPDISQER